MEEREEIPGSDSSNVRRNLVIGNLGLKAGDLILQFVVAFLPLFLLPVAGRGVTPVLWRDVPPLVIQIRDSADCPENLAGSELWESLVKATQFPGCRFPDLRNANGENPPGKRLRGWGGLDGV